MSERQLSEVSRERRVLADTFPVKNGAIAGLLLYVVGYFFTYVLAEADGEITFGSVFDALAGSTFQGVGLIFYNAHLVDIKLSETTIRSTRSETLNLLIDGSTGFPVLVYYAVPALLLILGGFFVALTARMFKPTDALKTGVVMTVGYLPPTVVGSFVFQLSQEASSFGQTVSVSAGPRLVPSILFMGTLYPIVFGTVGAYLGYRLTHEEPHSEQSEF